MKKLLKSLFKNGNDGINWQNQDFINGAFEGLQLQTDLHMKTWSLGQEDQWNVDMTTGQLWLDFSDGTKAFSEIQIIGTYNPLDMTFLWAWEHPSVNDDLAKHAKIARDWGKQNNEPSFSKMKLKCSIDDVWKIAAVVNRVAKANGVYKGNSGTTQVFMTLETLTLTP